MNKLTDTFVLSNGVEVPCVGYGTYLTPNGEIAKNSVVEDMATITSMPELGFTGRLPENAPADAIV